jgi:hypothetical protein
MAVVGAFHPLWGGNANQSKGRHVRKAVVKNAAHTACGIEPNHLPHFAKTVTAQRVFHYVTGS